MNLGQMIWAYLRHRPWLTLLNVLLFALGVASLTVTLLFSQQTKFATDKGSPAA
ncbi:MAG: hypothetical protein ACKO1K_01430 [Burkholderiales bacterium]